MSDNHSIQIELNNGWLTYTLTCHAPETSMCRLTCTSAYCETVGTDDGTTCRTCGQPMRPLPIPPGECHISMFLEGSIEESYRGPARMFDVPVEISWQHEWVSWDLSRTPTIEEIQHGSD